MIKLKNKKAIKPKGTYNTSANRQIKDGVFKLLFEKPQNAAELYYALTDTKCSPDEIQVITITTTVSGKLKNDLAIVVKNKAIVLGEHQSTPNENMPIRFLMYIGQLYEKWIKMKGEEKFLYKSKIYKIPTPKFVVFYNGVTHRPEIETLRLSDSFEANNDKTLGALELEVPIYNINKGMNKEFFRKSNKLKQYSEFIAKIREFNKLYNDYDKAVKEAVIYCIDNNILGEFLKEQGGKIVSILSTEYNEEVAKRIYGEEQREEGKLEGIIEMAKNMLKTKMSKEEISKITGLSMDELINIESNQKE